MMSRLDSFTEEEKALRNAGVYLFFDGHEISPGMREGVTLMHKKILDLLDIQSPSRLPLGASVITGNLPVVMTGYAMGGEYLPAPTLDVRVSSLQNGEYILELDSVDALPLRWFGIPERQNLEAGFVYVIDVDPNYNLSDNLADYDFYDGKTAKYANTIYDFNRWNEGEFRDLSRLDLIYALSGIAPALKPVPGRQANIREKAAIVLNESKTPNLVATTLEFEDSLPTPSTVKTTMEYALPVTEERYRRLMFLPDKFTKVEGNLFSLLNGTYSEHILTFQEMFRLLEQNVSIMNQLGVRPGEVLWTRTARVIKREDEEIFKMVGLRREGLGVRVLEGNLRETETGYLALAF